MPLASGAGPALRWPTVKMPVFLGYILFGYPTTIWVGKRRRRNAFIAGVCRRGELPVPGSVAADELAGELVGWPCPGWAERDSGA